MLPGSAADCGKLIADDAMARRRGDRITLLCADAVAASAHDRFWHEAADPGCLLNCRCRG